MTQPTHVDDEMEPDPLLNRWTNAIIGACIEVHRELGPGLPEAVYEESLAIEMRARGIPFDRQVPISVRYHDQIVGEFRADFIVAGAVILELKAVESLGPIHTAQVISYLRASQMRLGLLINFNVRLLKDGIKRIAC